MHHSLAKVQAETPRNTLHDGYSICRQTAKQVMSTFPYVQAKIVTNAQTRY